MQHVKLLTKLTRSVWRNSPRDHWRRLARRNGASVDVPAWTRGKHRQWNRLPYYLELFREFAERAGCELDFRTRRVLEIGAGPALGFAPLALIDGATSCSIVDPGFLEFRGDRRFRDEFLYPLWSTHARLTRQDSMLGYGEFLSRVDAIDVHRVPIEELQSSNEPWDIVLSKSCLEHVGDLGRAVEVCHRASANGSVHLHYVDFTMHREVDRVGSPFGLTYRRSRNDNPEYLGSPSGLVNLLRHTEISDIFKGLFKSAVFFPLVDYFGRIDLDRVHPDWAGYDKRELAVANGVLVAVK